MEASAHGMHRRQNSLVRAALLLSGLAFCHQFSSLAFGAPHSLRRTMLRVLDVKTAPAPSVDDLFDQDVDPVDDALEDDSDEENDMRVVPKSSKEFKSYAYMKSVVPNMYPSINLDKSSISRPVASKLQAYFDEAMVNAVDLVVTRANCDEGRDNRGTVLHALALMPRRLDIAATVLPRRQRGLTRLRVYKGLQVKDDSVDENVLNVSGETEPAKLAQVMLYRLKKLVRTVQLSFLGGKAATRAMMAIEELYYISRNEIVIVPRLQINDVGGKATITVSVTLA